MSKQFGVKWLCSFFGISKSSYYYWVSKGKPLSNNWSNSNEDIIKELFYYYKKKHGYRMITLLLKRDYGLLLNPKTVYRYMKVMGLRANMNSKKVWKYPEDAKDDSCPNVLNRDFKAIKPNEKWCCDISYSKTKTKVVYTFAIKDLFDNRIVAHEISTNYKELVYTTMEHALKNNIYKNLIVHSDHGVHFTSNRYKNILKKYGVQQSMSRKGNPIDNSPIENFFKHMKRLYKKRYLKVSVLEEKILLSNYFVTYSNMPQIKLKGLSPTEFNLIGNNPNNVFL